MNKLSIFLAGIVVFACSQSFAEDIKGVFAGPYVSLGAGYQKNKIFNENVSSPGTSLSFDQPSSWDHNPALQLQAGYGFNLGSRFNLGANIFYNISNGNSGHIKSTFYQDDTKQKLENNLGISFEPGVYINNKLLSFLKVGYVRADKKYVRRNFAISLDDSIDGYLYGFGSKYMINKNVYLGADLTRYRYNSTKEATNLGFIPVIVTSKAEQTMGLISIGYKF